MNDPCQRVDAFFDGELEKAEADAFRAHLATCSKCAHELRELAKLEAIVGTHAEALRPRLAIEPAPVVPIVSHPRWRRAVPGVLVVALAAAAAWVLLSKRASLPSDAPPEPLALLDAPSRSTEARVAYGPADRYRPYDVARSSSASRGEHVSLEALARLEHDKDFGGVAAGLLLGGDRDRAAEYLDRAGKSPDTDVDRAVLALGRGELEEALNLLDAVIEQNPRHEQALWNMALVLREMHLELASAEAFEKVAALGSPGWSDEARGRAKATRDQYEDRAQSWLATKRAGLAMVDGGAAPPDESVRRYPSYVARFLYHALRAAPSRERVLALLPLATTLDRDPSGGGPLGRAVSRMAAGDFTRRAPLAAEYRRLFPKWIAFTFDDAETSAFLAKARAAGEDDLYFGAVDLTGRAADEAPALVAIAKAKRDPWMDLVARGATAAASEKHGDFAGAETTLRAAIAACDAEHVDYLCAKLEIQLVSLFVTLARTAEATTLVDAGLRQSRTTAHDQNFNFEFRMADVARQRGAFPLMKAYLRDTILREPNNCSGKRQAYEFLAAERLHVFDAKGARAEIEQAPHCDAPIAPLHAWVLTELQRLGETTAEGSALPDELALARPRWLAGDRALVDAARGDALAVRDPAAGAAMIRAALADAEKIPANDTMGKKARAWAHLSLAVDAAHEGRAGDALDEMVADAGGATDSRCSLAVGVLYERAFAVTKNASGEAVAYFDPHRPSPDIDAARLVPDDVRARLAACPSVRVFAPAPVHGTPGLLSDATAWSYHVGGERPATPAPSPAHRLLVTDVEAPASFGLPKLRPWRADPTADPSIVWLHGGTATPANVLSDMRHATEISIHAHGLVDFAVSDASLVVLSADEAGRSMLTAGDIRATHLTASPIVVLGACSAARVASFDHEPWGLPLAFLEAGARAVLASPAPVGDAEAAPFFEAVLARVRGGEAPAQALRDERVAWLARGASPWIRQVLLFD